MNAKAHPNDTSIKGPAGLTIVILIVILIFGLWPRGYRFRNNVEWTQGSPGIRFGKYGIAYRQPLAGWAAKDDSDPAAFSMELAFKLENHRTEGFSFILSLHNGTDGDQLLVGQWRSSIVVMNGDDYDYKRKVGRISVEETSALPVVRFLTVTTGAKGAKVYLDGQVAGVNKNLILRIPAGDRVGLLLGNSVYGRHSWRGELYGLSFYPNELTAEDVSRHFLSWSRSRNFLFANEDAPCLLYIFDEKDGTRIRDHSDGNQSLIIPSGMRILKKNILGGAWGEFGLNKLFVQDAVMNLLGFVPFGFVLVATLFRLGGRLRKHGIWIALLSGFTISLTIEIVQAWIPSRSSQLLDLVLNAMGAWMGAAIYRLFGFGKPGPQGQVRGIGLCRDIPKKNSGDRIQNSE